MYPLSEGMLNSLYLSYASAYSVLRNSSSHSLAFRLMACNYKIVLLVSNVCPFPLNDSAIQFVKNSVLLITFWFVVCTLRDSTNFSCLWLCKWHSLTNFVNGWFTLFHYVPEALDSKITTRELLRDGYIFMQRIEENIKAGEVCFVKQYINL